MGATGATADVSPLCEWERVAALARGHGLVDEVVAAVDAAGRCCEDGGCGALGASAAVATLAGALAQDASARLDVLAPIVAAVAADVGVPRDAFAVAVGERAFADATRLLLPPLVGVRVVLDVLRATAGVHGAALWAVGEEGDVSLLCAAGAGADGGGARRLVLAALAGSVDARRAQPVIRHGDVVGAIALPANRRVPACTAGLLRAAAASCGAILDRWMLLERRAESERLLVEEGERRLRRVGLDLHDGPLQGSAQLAGELKLLRAQLLELDLRAEVRGRLEGRLDDLLARLAHIDEELRELAAGFESPVVLRTSLEVALAEEVAAFGRRHGKRTSFSVDGWLDQLAPSHAVALYRMLQEALANVRQHSRAHSVAVRVETRVDGVRVEVEDDGVGFDPAAVSVDGASRRHLGLAGMRERALLLGGSARVESRPGGPTRVSLFLPLSVPLPDLVGDLVRALGGSRERSGEITSSR